MSARLDLPAALSALAEERPVFHSEADFQHALAWVLRERHPAIKVRLEYPVTLDGKRAHIDIWVRMDGHATVIELKYGTRKADFEVDGEGYDLRDGAPDWFRYDVWKDVARTEGLVEGGGADAGYVIALTNDHLLWREGSAEAISAAFHCHDGREVFGSLAWSRQAGSGSTEGRESPIKLSGAYVARWRDYSKPTPSRLGGEFRYLLLDVEAALGVS